MMRVFPPTCRSFESLALGAVALIASLAIAGAAEPEPTPATQAVPAPLPAPAPQTPWDRRASLPASDADAMFRLAEDFADLSASATTPDESKRALGEARRLFILAASAALSRRSTSPDTAPGAMLALAALADSPDESRWLRGVAQSIAPIPRSVRWEPSPRALAAGSGSYELAVAFGAHRSGEYRRVRDALRRHPDAVALLVRAGIDERQAQSLVTDLESDAARAAGCPRCKGERILRGPRTPDEAKPTVELCPVCLGNPAPIPALTPERFTSQLRAEALLLGAAPTTWSAQSKIDGAAPLRDIDPAAVAAHYGVDPTLTVFRNGAWKQP